MATPPQLTPEQRAAALAKAAEARAARAELKARLKMGSLTLAEALASDDSTVGKLKVVSLLESLPGVGKVKARKIMDDIGIADNRRVQGLGSQQRQSLPRSLEAGGVSPARIRDRSIIIVSGPGGVGKGTIVDALVRRDPRLWLSRSWTTRAAASRRSRRRVRVHRPAPRSSSASRPVASSSGPSSSATTTAPRHPSRVAGRDVVVLEIEVDGASRSRRVHPDAVLIFVLPPSRDEQERRLRGRGDPDDKVVDRLRKAEDEEPIGRALADHVVVNDDLDRTIDEMLAIIDARTASRSRLITGP